MNPSHTENAEHAESSENSASSENCECSASSHIALAAERTLTSERALTAIYPCKRRDGADENVDVDEDEDESTTSVSYYFSDEESEADIAAAAARRRDDDDTILREQPLELHDQVRHWVHRNRFLGFVAAVCALMVSHTFLMAYEYHGGGDAGTRAATRSATTGSATDFAIHDVTVNVATSNGRETFLNATSSSHDQFLGNTDTDSPSASMDVTNTTIAVPMVIRCIGGSMMHSDATTSILELEIHLLTNLIHSALLGTAALLVVVRGSVVWLCFCQNVVLVWCWLCVLWLATATHEVSLAPVLPFGFLCALVLWQTARVYRRLPTGSCVLHVAACAWQGLVLVNIVCSALDYLSARTSESVCNSAMGIAPFVMGYSEMAHGAFLLALVQQAAIYSDDRVCLAGAALVAVWRLLLRIGPYNNTPLALVVADTLLMGLVLFETGRLLLGKHRHEQNSYEAAKDEDDDEELQLKGDVCGEGVTSANFLLFACTTTQSIAQNLNASMRQRRGAHILEWGSRVLLAEMTAEIIFLLVRDYSDGNNSVSNHDLYKWGMHAVVMYVFVTAMSVQSSTVYRYARSLLVVACPTGVAVAAWQMYAVDQLSVVAATLCTARAISGIMQTVGVIWLDDIPEWPPSVHTEGTLDTSRVQHACAAARRALFFVFLPSLALYIVYVLLYNQDGEPAAKMLRLQPESSPSLGLFFHFGIVLVIFAYDGIRYNVLPSYAPSLRIACLCAANLAVVLGSSAVLGLVRSLFAQDSTTWIEEIVLVVWMLASCYLTLCLWHTWNHRLIVHN